MGHVFVSLDMLASFASGCKKEFDDASCLISRSGGKLLSFQIKVLDEKKEYYHKSP